MWSVPGPDASDGSRTRDHYTGQRWAMGWGWSVGWQLWVTDRTVSPTRASPVRAAGAGPAGGFGRDVNELSGWGER